VHISGFSTNNVSVTPSNQSTNVYVTDSDMKGSCGAAPNGIRVAPGVPLRANVFVDGSSFTNLATALLVDANGHAFVTGSTFFNNSEGLSTMNGGVIDGLGGNHFGGNAYNGAFNTGSRSASRSAAARIGRRTGNRSTRWLTRAVRRV
ncbi:MAG: hypothetical protein QOF76_3696, partial [Solirubrobacteraceae bacterium]|nr:hypothetical protein [Solirubrobacteraceae bacterium]